MNLNLSNKAKQKKFLLLAGKPICSVDIVKYAKELGCYVIVCDYLPKEESLAKQFADECWDYSTNDIDSIVERAKKDKVEAVFTGVHDLNIAYCREICERLNLPFYTSKNEMDLAFNKRIYKDIFKECGIDLIPEYTIFDKKIPQDIHYPVLIKPVDSTGAYGLQICHTKEDINQKLEESLSFSQSKQIIVEEYLQEKEEITSVYIIKNGIPYLASVADRVVKHFDNSVIPLPIEYIWNSKYIKLYEEKIDEKIKKALCQMSLQNGMIFLQSIVKNNVIMPYDMGFRLSGTQEHVILEHACGYNPLKLYVDYSLTASFGDEDLINKINPYLCENFVQITFLVKPSTLGYFTGLDDLENCPEVIRFIKNKQEGETIPKSALGTLNQVALRVFAKVEKDKDMHEFIDKIRSIVGIYSTENENIVL